MNFDGGIIGYGFKDRRIKMKPRGYLIIGVICAILFVAWSIAGAVEKDCVIDYKQAFEWKAVQKSSPDGHGTYFVVKENPDLAHPVSYVLFKVYLGLEVTAFAYYCKDNLVLYNVWPGGRTEEIDAKKVFPRVRELIDDFLLPWVNVKKFDEKKGV